jgi:hypothetical protein
MNLGKDLGHLTYSTLVHPADNWEQLWHSVNTYLPQVKARMAPGEKFGVCLRTAAPSAAALSANPSKRAALKQFFADNDLYLYTANAFPYGAFKGQVIKEEVYEPDWRTESASSTRCRWPTCSRRLRRNESSHRFKALRWASSRGSPATTWSNGTRRTCFESWRTS